MVSIPNMLVTTCSKIFHPNTFRLLRLNQKISYRYATASGSKRVGQKDYQKNVLDYLAAHPPPDEKERKKRSSHELTPAQLQALHEALGLDTEGVDAAVQQAILSEFPSMGS